MPFPLVIPIVIGAIATFGAAKVVSEVHRSRPIADLAGSEWGLRDGDPEIFIAFKIDGEVIGFGGCNNVFGQYTRDGDALHFGALASTRKMCADKMESEAAFLNTLRETRSARGSHRLLTLYDRSGAELVRLRRRDWD